MDLGSIWNIVKTGASIYSTVKSKAKDRSPTPLIEEPSISGMFEMTSSGMEKGAETKAPDVYNYDEVLSSWLQRISRFTQS